jgi:hypothetical protein
MDRRASSLSVRRVSELMSRLEQLEKQNREQTKFLQIQFKRIAQMQAELDRLNARNRNVKIRPRLESAGDFSIDAHG